MTPHAISSSNEPELYRDTTSHVDLNGHIDSTCTPTEDRPKEDRLSFLPSTPQDVLHDLICVGFGPASLAIAVALNDAIEYQDPVLPHISSSTPPKVCFLEKQGHFGWHSGMQLDGATMQISWIKDLATLRNPRSAFTFLNYLHANDRLVPFTNLGTFLPLRVEYEDYMRWCANHFDDTVRYQQEGLEVVPVKVRDTDSATDAFEVRTRNLQTGEIEIRTSRHVVLSLGGKPKIPSSLPQDHPRVIHTSSFSWTVPKILPDRERPYTIVVIGAGQSAAETFNDLHTRYPNSQTRLVIRSGALKPSDDSPFVNEIFDPDRINTTFLAPAEKRAADLATYRDTNYGVVRLELLEHIHAQMYKQRLRYRSESEWPHRILSHREVVGIGEAHEGDGVVNGSTAKANTVEVQLIYHRPTQVVFGSPTKRKETIHADLVVVASGYERNTHEKLLQPARHLLPDDRVRDEAKWTVGRDYRVQFGQGKVASDAGVWLQGCNEGTHGLSDTLLSVLATRSGEVVRSIFAPHEPKSSHANGCR